MRGDGFATGNDEKMESQFTNWHAYYRCGANGVRIPTIRKKHYMPSALCNIGSEPEDVYLYKQAYWFSELDGRQVFLPDKETGLVDPATSARVSLLMSPNHLGWYHMEEITEPEVIKQLIMLLE